MRKAAMAGILLLVVFAVASCSDDDSTGSKDSTRPSVSITTPKSGVTREGIVDVVIEASDNKAVKKVEFYAENALVGTDETTPYEIEWDISRYDDDTSLDFYARAYDTSGNSQATDTWTLTKGPSKAPVATLTSPSDGWTVMQGYLTELKGTATDEEDGALADANIVWTSSLQGELKSGTDVEYRGFVIGTHEITMTATDSDGNIDTETVTITVTDNDQDYAYIQEGTYTIGAPLFDEETVTFKRPFLVSKTELSLSEFIADFSTDYIVQKTDYTGRGKVISTKTFDGSGESYFDAGLVSDVDTYGDYPAIFFTLLEFAGYCEALNDRDGYNYSFKYLKSDGTTITSVSTKAKNIVLGTYDDSSYDLNGWRLPTEAEWMVAAGGALDGRAYPWGDEGPGARANTLADPNPPNAIDLSQGRGTVPVDSYSGGASPYGILNMAGNVAEMCIDMYLPYIPSGTDYCGYTDDSYIEYVVKGGTWYSNGTGARIPMRDMWIDFQLKGASSIRAYDAGTGARIIRNLDVGEAPW